MARLMTVPAGQTRLIPALWKEVPKGRTFIFNGCIAEASNALISSDTAPGVKAAALALLAIAGIATTGTSGGAIDIANVKILLKIDLTPEISAVATGEIVP
ncbi:uncharacterized protein FFB20_14825 [Fusarium fujikuroi]|nr:uncharacterized protein FFB20_02628 [Fusarium fujikuroi]SCO15728.1 uncharacterized protein FFB20_14825 [Fusarium fujikuroi]